MSTMTAAVLRRHGDRDAVRLEQVAIPEPGPGQVRLRVRACALNWLDVGVRSDPRFGTIPLPLIGGAATWPASVRALARNGRLVACGSHSGTAVELDIAQIYHRQLQIRGSNGGTC